MNETRRIYVSRNAYSIYFFSVIASFIFFLNQPEDKVQFGINGMTETRCIKGYEFVMSQDGRAIQILDPFGKGVTCK